MQIKNTHPCFGPMPSMQVSWFLGRAFVHTGSLSLFTGARKIRCALLTSTHPAAPQRRRQQQPPFVVLCNCVKWGHKAPRYNQSQWVTPPVWVDSRWAGSVAMQHVVSPVRTTERLSTPECWFLRRLIVSHLFHKLCFQQQQRQTVTRTLITRRCEISALQQTHRQHYEELVGWRRGTFSW